MAFTDYGQQRKCGTRQLCLMQALQLPPASYELHHMHLCIYLLLLPKMDSSIKSSQMKNISLFTISSGEWLTSSPPLFPGGGPGGPGGLAEERLPPGGVGGGRGGTGLRATGATMATAGCSKGHCECLPGVGGALCDRCLTDFWGFNLIGSGVAGALGCTRKHAPWRGLHREGVPQFRIH